MSRSAGVARQAQRRADGPQVRVVVRRPLDDGRRPPGQRGVRPVAQAGGVGEALDEAGSQVEHLRPWRRDDLGGEVGERGDDEEFHQPLSPGQG
ncbi:hypothetical protein GCM10020220_111740 [Nonomuraea rubra]|uniref:hypothetical protein n=1 Tax=Nonomuraea rubra TaxID=46180 RepID=UPI0031F0F34E